MFVANRTPTMNFWAITCVGWKKYVQTVDQRFRITMAVLDPRSIQKDKTDKFVLVVAIREDHEYLLCVLKHEEIYQINLNLVFDKGERITFWVKGNGNVCLSGYEIPDSALHEESEYLEGRALQRKEKIIKNPVCQELEVPTPRSKRKIDAEMNAYMDDRSASKLFGNFREGLNQNNTGEFEIDEDDEDESDSDYVFDDETSESEEESDSESVVEEDADVDVEENCEMPSSSGSQKRKHGKFPQFQKRFKDESFDDSSEDVICIQNESESDDVANSSIGNTPMPKKQVHVETSSSEKKKKKKKKRLSEISNISDKPNEDEKITDDKNTPDKQKKMPVQRLEGGVEIQDVVIGRGPVASKGKMLHVFYIGRLENKEVFDSRVPGKKPFSFKLGVKQVIPGWDVGLSGMKVGGKRKLKVPPNMGYGTAKNVGIPANSVLFFTVELHAVN